MKKEAIIILLLIIMFPPISAEVTCSDKSDPAMSQKNIEEGRVKTIRGVSIGVIRAEEVPAFRRISANLIVDAKALTLNNATRLVEIELLSGTYTVELINTTSQTATFKVDGNTGTIDLDEADKIKGLFISIVNLAHSVQTPETKIIIGTDAFTLSNTDTPSEIITLDDKKYLIELLSASDDDATINVYKCSTGIIIVLPDEVIEENNTLPILNESIPKPNPPPIIIEEENKTQQVIKEVENQTLFKKFIKWLKSIFSK
jgi:hypothetical protein